MKLRHPYGSLIDPEQPIRPAMSLFDSIDAPIEQPYLEILYVVEPIWTDGLLI